MRRCVLLAFAGLAPWSGSAAPAARECPAPPSRALLSDAVRSEALPAIVSAGHLDLGLEARRVAAWIGPQEALVLDGRRLRAGRRELRLSPAMATTLGRLEQWYAMTPPTLARPIRHDELDAAALSSASVDRIAEIFLDSIRAGVRLEGRWLVPETGGEAALGDELRLRTAPDPQWEAARALAALADRPAELDAFYRRHAERMAILDASRVLRSALERYDPKDPRTAAGLRLAATTVVENAAGAYGLDPETQFALIAGHDWCGRYVGRWHTHPPHDQGDGWGAGGEPSFTDLENAVRDGQFLTIAFHPDGFDLYDAAPLSAAGRVDLALLVRTRHRSPAWRERFSRIHEDLRRTSRP